ncbi:DUF6427 family protein [Polaribacter sp. Hel1_85]|uniref:DUF6427 family protein n=1 Tax=Polaribacter sp. Hel1_85 TaxID=1250005 RepID=UPI00052CC7D0|nr:DUF6427 family protein [Polaribacter sp. Hel1_85]KGL62262.1 conserved hypothetical membrane protein [Polaribacter sp. Hel1_85]
MLANFLEKSKPINFIVYLGLFFCFFLITYFSAIFIDEFTWYKVFESFSYFFIFITIFFFYNFVVSKNKLTFDNSYAFFLFILAIIPLISIILDFKILTLLLIHLLFLRKIYSLRSSKKVIQKIFDSGFWLGVLCILEPFSILFSVIIYASILLQQKITIHTLITPVIGFVTPLIIYFAYLLWNDSTEVFTQLLDLNIAENIFLYEEKYILWIFGLVSLLTLFSTILKSPKALSVNNSFKKSWILLIINSVIAIVFALFITKKNGSEIIFLLIPASIIIANGFEVIQKNYLKNILFGLLFIGAITAFFWL